MHLVHKVYAVLLAGGSAFGLAAGDGPVAEGNVVNPQSGAILAGARVLRSDELADTLGVDPEGFIQPWGRCLKHADHGQGRG